MGMGCPSKELLFKYIKYETILKKKRTLFHLVIQMSDCSPPLLVYWLWFNWSLCQSPWRL